MATTETCAGCGTVAAAFPCQVDLGTGLTGSDDKGRIYSDHQLVSCRLCTECIEKYEREGRLVEVHGVAGATVAVDPAVRRINILEMALTIAAEWDDSIRGADGRAQAVLGWKAEAERRIKEVGK